MTPWRRSGWGAEKEVAVASPGTHHLLSPLPAHPELWQQRSTAIWRRLTAQEGERQECGGTASDGIAESWTTCLRTPRDWRREACTFLELLLRCVIHDLTAKCHPVKTPEVKTAPPTFPSFLQTQAWQTTGGNVRRAWHPPSQRRGRRWFA